MARLRDCVGRNKWWTKETSHRNVSLSLSLRRSLNDHNRGKKTEELIKRTTLHVFSHQQRCLWLPVEGCQERGYFGPLGLRRMSRVDIRVGPFPTIYHHTITDSQSPNLQQSSLFAILKFVDTLERVFLKEYFYS